VHSCRIVLHASMSQRASRQILVQPGPILVFGHSEVGTMLCSGGRCRCIRGRSNRAFADLMQVLSKKIDTPRFIFRARSGKRQSSEFIQVESHAAIALLTAVKNYDSIILVSCPTATFFALKPVNSGNGVIYGVIPICHFPMYQDLTRASVLEPQATSAARH
jgi:hypothetical protein